MYNKGHTRLIFLIKKKFFENFYLLESILLFCLLWASPLQKSIFYLEAVTTQIIYFPRWRIYIRLKRKKGLHLIIICFCHLIFFNKSISSKGLLCYLLTKVMLTLKIFDLPSLLKCFS